MRQPHGIRYAVLGVVGQHPTGVHGYGLKRDCDRVLGHFWQLNYGEVYRVLDQLVDDNLVTLASTTSVRKLYRITTKGQQSLDDFVCQPLTDAPRPLRQELAVKLLFATAQRLPELLRVIDQQRTAYLIDQQRTAYLKEVSRLGAAKRRLAQRVPPGDNAFVTRLSIEGAEMQARTEVAWLDAVTERLQEQFATTP